MGTHNFVHDLLEAVVDSGGYIYGRGATVPADAASGWAKGAIFVQTDGVAGTILYVNEGTYDSADFNTAVNATNAALTDVTAGTVAASKAVVVDANKDIGGFRNLDAVNLDAGASGTAGSVDVFPATALKGKLAITCANQAGNTTVTLNVAEMGQATTITLPDPGGAASVVLTAGAQTIAGAKTFSSTIVGTGGVSTAAQGREATADGLTTAIITATGARTFVTVTCDQEDKIIVLPTPVVGAEVWLQNGLTGYELRSSTPATISINGGLGANAESAVAAGTLVRCVCTSATTWVATQFAVNGTESALAAAAA
jgi:hypothetical protein